jgi:hypothetical protein
MPSSPTPVISHILLRLRIYRLVPSLRVDAVGDHVHFRSSIGSLSLRPAIPCPTLNPARRHARLKDSVPVRVRSTPPVLDSHLYD